MGQEEQQVNEDYALELAQIRTLEGVYRDIENLRQEGKSFGHPSFFKYFICGGLALLKDGLDIAATLAVFTMPVWWLIGPFLSFIILLVFWFANIKQKKAKDFLNNLENKMGVIQANIAHAVRVVSRIPGAKKKVAAIGIAKIASFAGRSPVITIAVGTGLETIPLISLVPWNILAVILSYLDERKLYKNADQNSKEAHAQLSSQIGEVVNSI